MGQVTGEGNGQASTAKTGVLKRLRLVLWALVALSALAAAVMRWGIPLLAEAPLNLGEGDYLLQETSGRPFTQASLKGQPTLVFFGFTHCPDVCPTTLGDVAGWKQALGAAGEDLRLVMISVDPERDRPEVLAEYLSWMPGAVGVTGSADETRKALRAFRVFAAKVALEGGGHVFDHSSAVLAFDANGQFQATIPWQARDEDALAVLTALLKP